MILRVGSVSNQLVDEMTKSTKLHVGEYRIN